MRTTEPPTIAHGTPRPHQPALDHASRIGAWVVRALAIPPDQRRITPALALHDHVIEHHIGTVTLAERQVFGAMLSLLRPMIDRHVCALWVERLAPDAAQAFLTGTEPPDTDSLIRTMRRAKRLGEADALLAAWERSALHQHPSLAPADGADVARGQANVQYVPTLDDVVDALHFSSGLALLSTMRMAQLVGDGGAEQSARFRLSVLPGVAR